MLPVFFSNSLEFRQKEGNAARFFSEQSRV